MRRWAVMVRGELIGSYVAPSEGEPMEAPARPGSSRGSASTATGTPRPPGKFSADQRGGRQVTLIEHEAVEAAAHEGGIELADVDIRRNLVTLGVPLNHLVGCDFRVGDVVLRGQRLAEPCAYLEGLLGREGVRKALIHRGGLRADIIAGGTITTGDEIEALA